jgi:hypothetical protein
MGSALRTHNGHPALVGVGHDSDRHFRRAIVERFQLLVKNPNEFGARNLDFSHAALPCKKTGSQHFNILGCPICKLEVVSYARRAVELRRFYIRLINTRDQEQRALFPTLPLDDLPMRPARALIGDALDDPEPGASR